MANQSLTIGIKSIGISIQHRLTGAQPRRGTVAIRDIVGSGRVDTRRMRLLMDDGRSLILCVARARQRGQGREKEIAVGDEVGGGSSVCEHVRRTRLVDV